VRYVQLLSNLLHAAGLLSRYAEFPAIFSKIRSLPHLHSHGDNQVLQTLNYYELLYYMNVADWKTALGTAKEAIAFLETAGDRIALGRKLAFWYNLSILFFIHEDFKSALHWVNAIMDGSGPEIREDIQHFARLLVILIHFELGHWEILEYLHRSSYRYLFNRNQLFPMKSAFWMP
jgi:tetratricopeptide (TPR) repeat protein